MPHVCVQGVDRIPGSHNLFLMLPIIPAVARTVRTCEHVSRESLTHAPEKEMHGKELFKNIELAHRHSNVNIQIEHGLALVPAYSHVSAM